MIESGIQVVIVKLFEHRENVQVGDLGTVESVHHNPSCKVTVRLRKGGKVQLPEECIQEAGSR